MNDRLLFADTNLFLRFLTRDVPEQAEAVRELLIRAERGDIDLVTTPMVIAEIVWVLETLYEKTKDDIQQLILSLLNTPGLEVDQGNRVVRALSWYVDKNIDFIDAYNAAWMVDQGLDSIYTFDRKHFSRIAGIKVLVPGES